MTEAEARQKIIDELNKPEFPVYIDELKSEYEGNFCFKIHFYRNEFSVGKLHYPAGMVYTECVVSEKGIMIAPM